MKAVLIAVMLAIAMPQPTNVLVCLTHTAFPANGSVALGTTFVQAARGQLQARYRIVSCADAMFALSIVTADVSNDYLVVSAAVAIRNTNGYDYLVTHHVLSGTKVQLTTLATSLRTMASLSIDPLVQALRNKANK